MNTYIEACASDTGLFWSVMRFNMGITESIRDMPCTELLGYSYILLIAQILFAAIVAIYAADSLIRRFL